MIAAAMTARLSVTMFSSGGRSGLALVQKMPAVTSSESPGRKKPTSRPVSAKIDRGDQREAADPHQSLDVINLVEQV